MTKFDLFTSASALAVMLGAPAFAQTEISTGANVAGVTQVDDRITDVEDAVRDDFARSNDPARFGPADRRTGTFGSVALTYAGRTGNTENQDFNLAGRLSHNQGPFQQSVGILLEYSEDDNGETDTKKTSVIYDGNYYLNDKVYAFILGRVSTDGLAEDYDELNPGDFDSVEDYNDEVLSYEGRAKRELLSLQRERDRSDVVRDRRERNLLTFDLAPPIAGGALVAGIGTGTGLAWLSSR